MGTTTYGPSSSSASDCAVYVPGWGPGTGGEAAKCRQGSFAGANVTRELLLLLLLLPLLLLLLLLRDCRVTSATENLMRSISLLPFSL
jgi:hypothetical protein